MLTTKRDYKDLVHFAKRPSSVFSRCSDDNPNMQSFTVALVHGSDAENAVVTCLMCIGGQYGEA
jgi:arginine utilization protein RocB